MMWKGISSKDMKVFSMKTAIFEKAGSMIVEEVAKPSLQADDDVIIKMFGPVSVDQICGPIPMVIIRKVIPSTVDMRPWVPSKKLGLP